MDRHIPPGCPLGLFTPGQCCVVFFFDLVRSRLAYVSFSNDFKETIISNVSFACSNISGNKYFAKSQLSPLPDGLRGDASTSRYAILSSCWGFMKIVRSVKAYEKTYLYVSENLMPASNLKPKGLYSTRCSFEHLLYRHHNDIQ